MMKIDLSGQWQVKLDAEKQETMPQVYPETMMLPGTTSAAGLGMPNPAKETGCLTDAYRFEGAVWFMRTFTAGDWTGEQTMLTLERTRKTTVYLDGRPIGHQESLCTPHRYFLPPVHAGEHTLVIRVDNTDYPTRGGHLTSPDTQSNWNGITGEISLTVAHTLLTDLTVRPDLRRGCLRVHGHIIGAPDGVAGIVLPGQMEHLLPYRRGVLDGECPLKGNEAFWDEAHPEIHTISIDLDGDVYETTFGLRDVRTLGRRLLINGRETFLRGKVDNLLYPKTGYTPTDVASWMTILGIAKEYGINHYRYHTACPPDAAFTAADLLGVYMAPELPFWGTVAEEGEEGYDERERDFLFQEGFRILREYGHHPSFLWLSLGNELWGSKDVLNRMMRAYREADDTKLYSSGANNYQFVPDVLDEENVFVGVRLGRERLIRGSYAMCDAPQGIVQTTAPESVSNYDASIVPETLGQSGEAGKVQIQYGTGVKEVDAQSADALIPDVPVISHEVGQYVFYPDFSEIPHYTGPLKPRNIEAMRENLERAGLYGEHEAFFRQTGHLAVDCYKREIETLLRSREVSGFQLLDLQDYTGQGTALVGVLNAMMENKGLISAEEWREFCAGTVVLGEFASFTGVMGEDIRFDVQISECDPEKQHTCIRCTLMDGERELYACDVTPGARQGRLTDAVSVTFPAECYRDAMQERITGLTVVLTLADGTRNHYPIWLIPPIDIRITREGIEKDGRMVAFVSAEEKADGAAIVVPSAEGQLPAEYCTDFWCYPMFRSICESMGKPVPVGTMGLSIDTASPLLKRFAQEDYTTPAWYAILQTAHVQRLPADIRPAVQMIDNTERCARLGILYQQDGVWHLTARLWEKPNDPTVRALAWSLWEALK
jgi:glycoside hydrolase family 2 sugar binding